MSGLFRRVGPDQPDPQSISAWQVRIERCKPIPVRRSSDASRFRSWVARLGIGLGAVALEASGNEVVERVAAALGNGPDVIATCTAVLQQGQHLLPFPVLMVVASSRRQGVEELERGAEEDGLAAVAAMPSVSIPNAQLNLLLQGFALRHGQDASQVRAFRERPILVERCPDPGGGVVTRRASRGSIARP